MARDLTAGMITEVQEPLIKPVWILRLDIDTDPVYAWTGRVDFMPTGTGDTALDGFTFIGLGNIGKIGNIEDAENGSSAVQLVLPGVDLNETALQQVVLNERLWQNRQGWIWFGLLNTTYGVIVNPVRVKTGRIDQMTVAGDGSSGTVMVTLESHQSYVSQALNTRYSQQNELDATDTSQDYVHDLANKQPGIGVNTTTPAAGSFRDFKASQVGRERRAFL